MHIKTIILGLILLVTFLNGATAQELTVRSLATDPHAIIAVEDEKRDLAGKVCGLVKVQLPVEGAVFEGCVTTVNKIGEYWVYMEDGSYMLTVKHAKFHPLSINFRDHGIERIEGKRTYILTLQIPQTRDMVQKQKLIINYSPASALVLIDSKPYKGNGRVETDLTLGSHTYIIAAEGYETAESSMKLNGGAPRTITENLVAMAQTPTVKHQAETDTPQQQEVTTENPVSSSMTASQLKVLGDDYYHGKNGKIKDYAEAVKWYRAAAEQGNVEGQIMLGKMYQYSYGVDQDYNEAIKWYRKAAEQGNAEGQNCLGGMYVVGEAKDYNEAIKWFQMAAKQGNVGGQNNLGLMYKNGFGVAKDYNKAIKWYRKAAEQGDDLGQNNLGLMYYFGYGVATDYNEAAKWFRKAAEQGHSMGQYNLGWMYENGYGVNQDLSLAKYWYQKSAQQGGSSAKERLQKLK